MLSVTRRAARLLGKCPSAPPEIALAARFGHQFGLRNDNIMRERLAHIINGQSRHRGSNKGFHLNARFAFGRNGTVDYRIVAL